MYCNHREVAPAVKPGSHLPAMVPAIVSTALSATGREPPYACNVATRVWPSWTFRHCQWHNDGPNALRNAFRKSPHLLLCRTASTSGESENQALVCSMRCITSVHTCQLSRIQNCQLSRIQTCQLSRISGPLQYFNCQSLGPQPQIYNLYITYKPQENICETNNTSYYYYISHYC